MHEQMPVLARTLRGVEWIAAGEIRSRLGIDDVETGHRELRFSAPLVPALLELGTVDDVFLVLAELDGFTHRRESLARLATLQLDLDALAGRLGRSGAWTYDITASFLGRRNYSRFELEDALADVTGWRRVARRGALSLRVHVVGSVASVAVRIARAPLHRRAYRAGSVPGSLHPPLARALALLAGVPFVDPFCGAGTIPIEGALAGLATAGSDIDSDAVRIARRNAAAAGVVVSFSVADAAALGPADCVVTNPPWGKAVPFGPSALPHARRLVLLTAERPELEHVLHQQAVRVHGTLATITVAEC